MKNKVKIEASSPLQAARTSYQNTIISVTCPREEFWVSDCFSTPSSVGKEFKLSPRLLSVIGSSESGIWTKKPDRTWDRES